MKKIFCSMILCLSITLGVKVVAQDEDLFLDDEELVEEQPVASTVQKKSGDDEELLDDFGDLDEEESLTAKPVAKKESGGDDELLDDFGEDKLGEEGEAEEEEEPKEGESEEEKLETFGALKEQLVSFLGGAIKNAREEEFTTQIAGTRDIKVSFYRYIDMRFWQLCNNILFKGFEGDQDYLYDDSGVSLKGAVTAISAVLSRSFKDVKRAEEYFRKTPAGKSAYVEVMREPVMALKRQYKPYRTAYYRYRKVPSEETFEAYKEARLEREELTNVASEAYREFRKQAMRYVFPRVKGMKESVMGFLAREGKRAVKRTKYYQQAAEQVSPFLEDLGLTEDDLWDAFLGGEEGSEKVQEAHEDLNKKLEQKQQTYEETLEETSKQYDEAKEKKESITRESLEEAAKEEAAKEAEKRVTAETKEAEKEGAVVGEKKKKEEEDLLGIGEGEDIEGFDEDEEFDF